MARLGEKMRNAKRFHGGAETEWGGSKKIRGGDDRCPSCRKKYKDMSAAVFDAHTDSKGRVNGDCPDANG